MASVVANVFWGVQGRVCDTFKADTTDIRRHSHLIERIGHALSLGIIDARPKICIDENGEIYFASNTIFGSMLRTLTKQPSFCELILAGLPESMSNATPEEMGKRVGELLSHYRWDETEKDHIRFNFTQMLISYADRQKEKDCINAILDNFK